MKAIAALLSAPVAAPLMATDGPSLAGVSDDETEIRSGQIREFHRGHGDVFFMRDRENKWYRVQLNPGCLKGIGDPRAISVNARDVSGRVNKLSQVVVYDGMTAHCNIDSIRRSVAPPQVDSKSPITLD